MEEIKKKRKKDVGGTIFVITMLAVPVISFLFFYVYINFNSILMAFKEPLFDGHNGYKWALGTSKNSLKSFPNRACRTTWAYAC